MIRAYLLYTGPDGASHVAKGSIEDGAMTEVISIFFKETPAQSVFDWHNAPATQYVITLAGTLEFTTRDGGTFTICPGDILIATDVTGTGHKWRLVDEEPWKRAYVAFRENTHIHFHPGE